MTKIQKHTLIILTILGLQFSEFSAAEIFKCKTATGQTTYSSQKCTRTGEVFTLQKESSPEDNILAEQVKGRPNVDIYITSWCPYCKKTMAYFRSKNISFNSYDIEKNSRAKAKKNKLAPGYSGVPLTVINGTLIKGFSEKRFETALVIQ